MSYVYVVHIEYFWDETYRVKVFLHEKHAIQYAREHGLDNGKRIIKITEEKVYNSVKEEESFPRVIYW